MSRKGKVTITYCSQCRFILRATWLAQELLFTFQEDLLEVALRPGTGGEFKVELDGQLLVERVKGGTFPEPKAIKAMIRDHLFPQKNLGHSEPNPDTHA